jgi:nucleotide-binding universal stress UspA family protein
MFKRILIPTDGSTLSNKALKQGFALAKRLKSSVTVVHVYSPYVIGLGGDMGMGYATVEREMREFARSTGRKYLDRAETVAKAAGMKIERLLVEGMPTWKSIIDVARRKRCDAILMGAHGRGAMSALLLGSQTNAVLAHSKIPVVVYR